ncbi:MAG: acetate kinase [Pseudomonadota bacterium]
MPGGKGENLSEKIFVVNSGSSSVKYRQFDGSPENTRSKGLLEGIGTPRCRLHHWPAAGDEKHLPLGELDHHQALAQLLEFLEQEAVLNPLAPPRVIGHRVVHGGGRFTTPCLVDKEVLRRLKDLEDLAPLHNPANVAGAEVFHDHFPTVPQVAVFDTAFHRTLPEVAFRYALPEPYYTEHRVRRYGFHGISHQYVAKRAAVLLGRPFEELRLISLHLGNGASATAIDGGRSVDTSMGMTPAEGLMMGTRSGDLDPAIPLYLIEHAGLSPHQVDEALNQQGGLRAIGGSQDMREIITRMDQGDAAAALAFEMFCYRIRKYVGAYWAVLGGVDGLIFTAGIGENTPRVREKVVAGLEPWGVHLDAAANTGAVGREAVISTPGSGTAVLVIPTDEESEIARQALDCL